MKKILVFYKYKLGSGPENSDLINRALEVEKELMRNAERREMRPREI